MERSKEKTKVVPDATYREITVKLWGNGVVLRREVPGAQINGTERFVVRQNQFVLSRIDARNGALGIVPESLDGAIVSNDFPAFNPDPGKLLPAYLGWLCRTNDFVDKCRAASEGTTNRVRLKETRFLEIQIPLPPLSEQRRIVSRIEELAAKITEARSLRQQAADDAEAVIRSTTTQVDEEQRSKRPLVRLEGFASKERGSIRSGPFGSALLHSEFVSEGIPAVGIQDVRENGFELTRRWNVTPQKAEELRRYYIKPRDILVTVMGTLGRACVVPDDAPQMVSTKHIWTLTIDQDHGDPRWLSYWLNFSRLVRNELLGQGSGTAIPGLNGQKIRSVSLPNIPLPEQWRIVEELDALQEKVDALKGLQAETAAELDALLPSILDKAFQGQL